MRLLILLLTIATLCVGQQLNYRTTYLNITDFRADSAKATGLFSVTDYENLLVALRVDDTGSTGYANDSTALKWGIQYGWITKDYLGDADTSWIEPIIFIDSCRFTAGRYTSDTSWISTDSLERLKIDTTGINGYAEQVREIQPYLRPIARMVAWGLTGNNKSGFLRLQFAVGQRLQQLAGRK